MVSQIYGWMEGWMEGWMDGVSLRCSFCGKSDVWMDGWMDGWKKSTA